MPEPTKIPRPFADSGDKNSIPDSSGSIGFASWQEGFPAITSEPFASGGVAPKRADFNGIFNALSLATVWQQQGGVYAYDNTTDYEVGNIVLYSGDLYKCLVANGPNSSVKAPTDTTAWDKIAAVSDIAAEVANYQGGTLTPTAVLDTPDASAVVRMNKIGIYNLNCKLKNGALAGYSTYKLHTSTLKPKRNTIGLLTCQGTTPGGVFLMITTDGDVNLRTTAGQLPDANTYYYGVIIFPVA